jgi:hypothetical protein
MSRRARREADIDLITEGLGELRQVLSTRDYDVTGELRESYRIARG